MALWIPLALFSVLPGMILEPCCDSIRNKPEVSMSPTAKPEAKAAQAPGHRVFAYRFAKIYTLLVQKAERKNRYLDKLIDELAKGRPMEKILRQDA
jgi:hypothetical protein